MNMHTLRFAFNSLRYREHLITRKIFTSQNIFSDYGQTPSSSDSSPDAIVRSGKHHAAAKAKKISKAMEAYIKAMTERDKIFNVEDAEFQLGKRHLANIMNVDPDTLSNYHINKALEYLFPSGLFSERARPRMLPASAIHGRLMPPQFAVSGRPFNDMFYTLRPSFYQILYEIYEKIEYVINYEASQMAKGITERPEPLKLPIGKWIVPRSKISKTKEKSFDRSDIEQIGKAMDYLLSLPYSYVVKDFIIQNRVNLEGEEKIDDPKPGRKLKTAEDGRQFIKTSGLRKTCLALVKLYSNGSGKVSINGKDLHHFEQIQSKELILAPFILLDRLGQFDVEATTTGGGESGAASAVRLGIARGLRWFVEKEELEKLRLAGYLRRDPRRKERNKHTHIGPRAKKIWKKR